MAEGGGKGIVNFIAVVVIGALLGSMLGELLGILVKDGVLHDLFVKGYLVGLENSRVDLKVLVFSLGASLKLNLCSFVGIAMGLLFFRK